MSDIWTMVWKEWNELVLQGGRAQYIRPVILIGIMGVALPLRIGRTWLELPIYVLLILLYVPFFTIISFIGDAIAGERERHTLETLLASRISDRAILLGKVIVTVAFTWALALAGLVLGAITANLSKVDKTVDGGWTFYHPLDVLVEAIALSLLVTLLAASGGVLVSLRVSTVRQAQQVLIVGTVVLMFGGLLIISLLPGDLLASFTYSQLLLIGIAVVAVLDAILLALSLVSFQRSRLILS